MDKSLFILIIKNIIIPLFTIYLVNKWNFFEIFTFIPTDKLFEFGLSSYLCIFQCIFYFIENKIIDKKSKIKCIFYSKNQRKNIDTTPDIEFVQDVAYVRGTIEVSGKGKRLSKTEIVLKFPNWVDIQVDNRDELITINNNDCIINISKFIPEGVNDIENATVNFTINLIKNYCGDREYSIVIAPSIKNSIYKEFRFNKFNLIGG